MKLTRTVLTVAVAVTVAVPTAAMAADGLRSEYRHVYIPTQACKTEDSSGPCFWDAGRRGNGHGASFWVDATGQHHYLDGRIERRAHPKPCGFFRTFCLFSHRR